jgi:hypothetical protein
MSMSSADVAMLAAIRSMVAQLAPGKMRRALEMALDGKEPEAPARKDPVRRMVITGDEAGMMLGVSRRTIIKWSNSGLLKRAKLPGRKLGFGYTLDSVEAAASSGVVA